jgi:RimJ/RimL family protein N-acetyltransferase/predicted N-acetyltransferase YhbS
VHAVLEFPMTTDRFTLAPLGAVDGPSFTAYRRDPDTARFQSWTPAWSEADTDTLLASQPSAVRAQSGEWLQIAVRDRTTSALVGDLAVHAVADQPDTYEVGVTLAPSSRGVGAGAEATGRLVEGLFRQQGAHRVFAVTDGRNAAAGRLFARLGFRHEGRAVEADWFKGEWTTLDTWAVLRSEFDDRHVPAFALRAGDPTEYPALVAIWRRAVDATHDFLSDEDRDAIEAQLATAYLPAVTLVVAESDGEPIGFAGVLDGVLEMLFVDPDRHGRGVGSALVARAVREHGVTRVDVNEQNPDATAFYVRRGFRTVGRSPTDEAGRPYPVLHLELGEPDAG